MPRFPFGCYLPVSALCDPLGSKQRTGMVHGVQLVQQMVQQMVQHRRVVHPGEGRDMLHSQHSQRADT